MEWFVVATIAFILVALECDRSGHPSWAIPFLSFSAFASGIGCAYAGSEGDALLAIALLFACVTSVLSIFDQALKAMMWPSDPEDEPPPGYLHPGLDTKKNRGWNSYPNIAASNRGDFNKKYPIY